MYEEVSQPLRSWRQHLDRGTDYVDENVRTVRLYALRSTNWLGLAFSAVALCLSLWRVHWTDARAALTGLNGILLALAVVTALVTTIAKAARWRSLLTPDQVPLNGLLFTICMAQLTNSLVPGRLGELARVYLLGERRRLGKARVLSTILIEKLLDVAMLLGVLVGLLAGPGERLPSWFRPSALPLTGIALTLLALVLLTQRGGDILNHVAIRLPTTWRQRFLQGAEAIETRVHAGVLISGMIWSVLIWILAASTNFLLLGAFRLHGQLPFSASLIILVAVHVGALVPAAPAQIGVFHYFCAFPLTSLGVEQSVALSYAVALHLLVYFPIVTLGSLGLWQERWGLRLLLWPRSARPRS
jgi:uncharacterized protein (TIRG00374 family)